MERYEHLELARTVRKLTEQGDGHSVYYSSSTTQTPEVYFDGNCTKSLLHIVITIRIVT